MAKCIIYGFKPIQIKENERTFNIDFNRTISALSRLFSDNNIASVIFSGSGRDKALPCEDDDE